MIKVSKELDYALILLTAIARTKVGTYQNLSRISRSHHLPYKYIGTIAAKLTHVGLLTSKEGSGGGYRLNKEPPNISLKDIIQALGKSIPTSAFTDCPHCPRRRSCRHQPVLDKLVTVLTNHMNHIFLSDLI